MEPRAIVLQPWSAKYKRQELETLERGVRACGYLEKCVEPEHALTIVPGVGLPKPGSHASPTIASPNPEPGSCIRRQAQQKQHPAALEDGVCPENGHTHLPLLSSSEDAQGTQQLDIFRLYHGV